MVVTNDVQGQRRLVPDKTSSDDSSVGRASDCNVAQVSGGPQFEPGSSDLSFPKMHVNNNETF
jgi:hypothetical protein